MKLSDMIALALKPQRTSMPIFIEIGQLGVVLADPRKIVSNVGLSSKIPIFGFSSPISLNIELKFLL